jgi:glycosyltransferase involved in cell wall biosynthesis
MVENGHPLVTIGIPTYNRADSYLRKTLTSALNQTYQNVEIIVSDNCSTDSTEPFVRGLSDPRIRYFKHTNNIGGNNNFNFCLAEAKGDYFLLLHDDDLIDDDFIDVCMSAANYQTDIGIIRTGTRVIDSDGLVLRQYPNMAVGLSTEDFFRAWFACKTSLYLCSTLFNTKKLMDIGGFSSKNNLLQDVFAEVQLGARFGRVDVENVKASFRKHPEERTFSVRISEWCEDSVLLIELMCDLARSDQSILRKEAMRFLSGMNYTFASKAKSPIKRFMAYLVVFKSFNYQYAPPPVRRGLHFAQRIIKQALARQAQIE